MDGPFVATYLDGLRGALDGIDQAAVARVIDVLWEAYR